MRSTLCNLALVSFALLAGERAVAHAPPLLPEPQVAALVNELSGESAKRNLEGLAQLHRQRGSRGFHAAAELIAGRATRYGLAHVEILKFPADGRIFYGTQRSRPAWDADEGELTEIRPEGEVKMASYAAQPIVLAEDSESADVTADLIDVGDGSKESDYAGKDVRGRIVLVAAQADAAQDLAGRYGAAGIVSYALNQATAWSGENDNLIRWGHLETFSAHPTFAFMISLRTARSLQKRLSQGEQIRLHARVVAGQHAGDYEIVTATIDGADLRLRDQEIAFSCHLDHQRPGANDNASGCVTILEVARTLQKLIEAGTLPRPARTIRFIWPPEIEGTLALLNARPEFAQRIRAVVHMDMVGGGPVTQAVFHVTRGPRSLPSFVHDVAWSFASWLNTESYEFAATGEAQYPLAAPEGGREPLRADYSAYTMGSDHDVYQDSSFGIPAIYLNDWPDRFIHTNLDTAANIDPTKLRRAAFIGAASGYFLAGFSPAQVPAARRATALGKLVRAANSLERGTPADSDERYEHAVLASIDAFGADARPGTRSDRSGASRRSDDSRRSDAPRRTGEPRGPLLGMFGYDYFADHAKAAGIASPRLLEYHGSWGAGEEYAYEAVNFADGRHSIQQIRDELTAEFGPVPLEMVEEYLRALRGLHLVN